MLGVIGIPECPQQVVKAMNEAEAYTVNLAPGVDQQKKEELFFVTSP